MKSFKEFLNEASGTKYQQVLDRAKKAGLRISQGEGVEAKNDDQDRKLNDVLSAVSADWKNEKGSRAYERVWTNGSESFIVNYRYGSKGLTAIYPNHEQ